MTNDTFAERLDRAIERSNAARLPRLIEAQAIREDES